ncbi:MAG: cytochrome c oxidase assembly protein [Endozoicomonas sp. (ex Botrylloides leachii)]|nr:cytochrome c oxidase assembly protein [Endozoicomonas sp. (ex Botrylloides leachii)]
MSKSDDKKMNTRRTLIRSILIAVGMFGFGFAMVPLYDVFCQVTGLNGKTSDTPYENKRAEIDVTRTVKVQFISTKNGDIKWDFFPSISEIDLHPGEVGELSFIIKNPTDKKVVTQSIPSVSPFQATNYLHKVECFCFTTQTLKAREERVMPLRVIVDQDLPKHIKKLTLSYTLFDVTHLNEKVEGET